MEEVAVPEPQSKKGPPENKSQLSPRMLAALKAAYPDDVKRLTRRAWDLHRRSRGLVHIDDCMGEAIVELESPRAAKFERRPVPERPGFKAPVELVPAEDAALYDAGREIDRLTNAARIGRSGARLLARYQKLLDEAAKNGYPPPLRDEAAEALGVTLKRLDKILDHAPGLDPRRNLALDAERWDDDEGQQDGLQDGHAVIADRGVVSALDLAIATEERDRTLDLLQQLSPAERAGVLGVDRPVSRQAQHAAMVRGFAKLLRMVADAGWSDADLGALERPRRPWPVPAKQHRVVKRLADHPGPGHLDIAADIAARMQGDRGAWRQP